jgi:predicted SAM-dependent methyltransferase
MSETAKIRDRVLKYCEGYGVDLGCGDDKIKSEAIGVDTKFDGWNLNEKLYFFNSVFDYVYSSHCLEHLIDYKRALTDWVRILKPGGHIILYLPHADYYKYKILPNGDIEFNPEHLHEFRPADIVPILESLGITIIENDLDVGVDRYSFLIVGIKQC